MARDPLKMKLEDNLFFLCTQVVHRRTRLLHEALREVSLLPTEFIVLSSALRKGPLSMQDLAQWTAYERTRLTHILNGMEARGWVTRTNLEADRRTIMVQITTAGRETFLQAKAIVDRITDRIVGNNTPQELEQIRHALGVMRDTLLEMEGPAPTR